MAAAVTVVGFAFSDLRFDTLAKLLGLADADHARGKMLRLWQFCTEKQSHSLSEVEISVVLGDQGVAALLESGLGEKDDEGNIRIKGTGARIDWYSREGQSRGGKNRMKNAKRDKGGRLLPNNATCNDRGDDDIPF